MMICENDAIVLSYGKLDCRCHILHIVFYKCTKTSLKNRLYQELLCGQFRKLRNAILKQKP